MFQETVVARVTDLKDGEMKEVEVDGAKVLLVRLKGRFFAIGGECSHYGGPLAEGALSGSRVVCPWHQATFNVQTGEVLEPPALDDLARFEVRVEGDQVIVRTPDTGAGPHPPQMCRCDSRADGRTLVILGAGAAGNVAAQTLRQDDFKGKVVMITQEMRLPYDRPNLSKGYLAGLAPPDSLPLRSEDFFRQIEVEVLLGRRVVQVNHGSREIIFHDGARLNYDGLLLATGSIPRRLAAPGADLENVFTLRSADDADAIMAAAPAGAQAVVVGGSFIGMEVAASLTKRGLQVAVTAPGATPFARTLGPEIGGVFQKLHEENGVAFHLGARVDKLEGRGRVEQVHLSTGVTLPADLVVVGIEVRPATDFLKGVDVNADGSVSVDECLKVAEGLYAAGDIARFPDWRTGEAMRIEHWRLAQQHGRVAAHNMAGKPVAFRGVPFFWTEHFDLNLQYVGFAAAWDDLIIHGDLAARNFLAFYVREGRVLAAAGINQDRKLAAIAELMRQEALPRLEELAAGPLDFSELLGRLPQLEA
ncbi:MAG: Rieske 2Fe-2S domain-containing protein [Deltaproteobacteria bacterium]|nr:Rieske 2Fe-2S domain-containing protein [Deltaproteobacteria bacterium]